MKRGKASYWLNCYHVAQFNGPTVLWTKRKLHAFINDHPGHKFAVLRWSGARYYYGADGKRVPSGIMVYGSSMSGVSWERDLTARPIDKKQGKTRKRVRK